MFVDYEQELQCKTCAEIQVRLYCMKCTLDAFSNQHLEHRPGKFEHLSTTPINKWWSDRHATGIIESLEESHLPKECFSFFLVVDVTRSKVDSNINLGREGRLGNEKPGQWSKKSLLWGGGRGRTVTLYDIQRETQWNEKEKLTL